MNRLTRRIIAGGFGGLFSTLPMSALMLLWHRRLSWTQREPLPPQQITVNAFNSAGLDDDLSRPQLEALAMINHFGYGTAMGSMYGLLTSARQPASQLSTGVVYGLGVWAVSYLGLLPTLGLYRSAIKESAERNLLMLTAHIVWGGALGLLTEVATYRADQGLTANKRSGAPDKMTSTARTDRGVRAQYESGNI